MLVGDEERRCGLPADIFVFSLSWAQGIREVDGQKRVMGVDDEHILLGVHVSLLASITPFLGVVH
jgi:hypothetical protein